MEGMGPKLIAMLMRSLLDPLGFSIAYGSWTHGYTK